MHFGENQLSPGSLGISPLPAAHPGLLQQAPVRPSTGVFRPLRPGHGWLTRFRVDPGRLVALRPSPFRTRVRSGSACSRLSLAARGHSSAHSTKGTPSPGFLPAPTGRGRTVSGAVSLPSPGCFSPFPHGTGPLSVARGVQPWAVVRPASRRVLRARRYSRDPRTGAAPPSPTGLSPAAAARSSGLRLEGRSWSAGEAPAGSSRGSVQPPAGIAGGLCRRPGLGSPPFARRYSGDPLSSSGY